MNTQMSASQKMGTSFFDQTLTFKGNFHSNRTKIFLQKK